MQMSCTFCGHDIQTQSLTCPSHVNSIDKFVNGDYLLSARHANTIYKISRSDKSIQWRLGGKLSDFTMDFNFTAQHHVKIISENASMTVISILDNASDGWHTPSANTSSALLVALHTSAQPKRAEVSHSSPGPRFLLIAIVTPTMVQARRQVVRQTW